MPDPELIRFIRDVLGCGCPNQVLESITVERRRPVQELEAELTRLDVGGRLLVYVVEVASVETLAVLIRRGLEAGLADRDGHGFNRFRLVLAAADPASIEPAARATFDAAELPDDRVHLHVVIAEQICFLR